MTRMAKEESRELQKKVASKYEKHDEIVALLKKENGLLDSQMKQLREKLAIKKIEIESAKNEKSV